MRIWPLACALVAVMVAAPSAAAQPVLSAPDEEWREESGDKIWGLRMLFAPTARTFWASPGSEPIDLRSFAYGVNPYGGLVLSPRLSFTLSPRLIRNLRGSQDDDDVWSVDLLTRFTGRLPLGNWVPQAFVGFGYSFARGITRDERDYEASGFAYTAGVGMRYRFADGFFLTSEIGYLRAIRDGRDAAGRTDHETAMWHVGVGIGVHVSKRR